MLSKNRSRPKCDTLEETLEEVLKRTRQENKNKRLQKQEKENENQEEIRKFEQLHSRLPKLSLRKLPVIDVKNVVPQNIKKGYTGHKQVTHEKIIDFVQKNITEGPQVINFAVGIYNHAVLVDVKPDNIYISDWKKDDFRKDLSNLNYTNYFQIIDELEKKFKPRKVLYYSVDPYIKKISEEKNMRKGNAGGCSEYLYDWINVYYRKGFYEDPFSIL